MASAAGDGTNARERNPSSTSKEKEEEEVVSAVSLLEFCANLDDYAPTVGIYISCGKYCDIQIELVKTSVLHLCI